MPVRVKDLVVTEHEAVFTLWIKEQARNILPSEQTIVRNFDELLRL